MHPLLKSAVLIFAAPLLPAVQLTDEKQSASPLGSFSQFDSPVADQTGKWCGLKHRGAVWFFAGTKSFRAAGSRFDRGELSVLPSSRQNAYDPRTLLER